MPKRRSPELIDWKLAAHRIAEGETPAAVAAILGIREERVWRHFETSTHFRTLIQQAAERHRLLTVVLNGVPEAGPHGTLREDPGIETTTNGHKRFETSANDY